MYDFKRTLSGIGLEKHMKTSRMFESPLCYDKPAHVRVCLFVSLFCLFVSLVGWFGVAFGWCVCLLAFLFVLLNLEHPRCLWALHLFNEADRSIS